MSEVAPVQEGSRIESLDVMRGFAVLGILVVNAAFFAAPWQTAVNPTLAPLAVTDETLWTWLLTHLFFENKCITLFSLLFGASIYLVGGETDDAARSVVLRRRLAWLLVFGVLHATLLWYGDILVTYALTGLLVARVRSWPPRALLTTGCTLFVFSIAWTLFAGSALAHTPPAQLAPVRAFAWAPTPEEIARITSAYRGGLMSALQENTTTWLQFMHGLPTLVIRTAALMLIGMALLKAGFLSGAAPRWAYLLSLVLGALALAIIGYQAWLNIGAGFDFVHMEARGTFANNALSIFVSLGYASLFVLLVKAGARLITAPLAAVGRMAFTNYLTQSLIMSTLFWGGRGLGLYGQLDRPTLLAIVVSIWALQLVWSSVWLSRFQMGPLEWLWRRLSYGRPVALSRAAIR